MPSAFGLFFLGVAAFFYACRYLCAAMICSSFASQSTGLFDAAYSYVGPNLTYLSAVAFLVGIGILFAPFWQQLGQSVKKELDQNSSNRGRR